MTTERRLERDLPQILGDLAMGPYPDYIDDVLATTAQRRQRPAWTFPERWLPMVDSARQPILTSRMPLRSITIALILIALLVAATAVFIGSQPRLPEPFGVAANGLVAYAADGDIYTADPVTEVATAVVSGPEFDLGPRYSRDGTHIVFERKLAGADGLGQLYVARHDGTELRVVTPEPVSLTPSLLGEPWPQYDFSPDGKSILFAWTAKGAANLSIADSSGGGVRQLEVGMPAYEPSFRPPDGTEISFVGPDTGPVGSGIFAVDVTTGAVRTIVRASSVFDVAGGTSSPDGSRMAYWRWGGFGSGYGISASVRVIAADGTGDRQLFSPPAAVWSMGTDWSNDGTRILTVRGYGPQHEDDRAVVIPVDGASPGIEIRIPELINGGCCSDWEWAPDDSAILGTPADDLGTPMQQIIIDLSTGQARSAPWSSTSDPTWQRRAP
jgi:WD40 repeat protein